MNDYMDAELAVARLRAHNLLQHLTGKTWKCYIGWHKRVHIGGSVIPHYMCTRCGDEYIDDNLDLQ